MIFADAQLSGKDFEFLAKVAIPIATFIAGFLLSRLTLTKNERKAHEDRQQKNADAYQIALNEEFVKFTNALAEYAQLKRDPTLQDFLSISQTGERYFTQLQMIADATFAGTIPQALSISNFSVAIKEAYERSIPHFYKVLKGIASKRDSLWKGEFRRANYESIVSYYETYCISKK